MPTFIVPGSRIKFDIPDNWWQFCDLEDFKPVTMFYLCSQRDVGVQTVSIAEVRPPERTTGFVGFHKNLIFRLPLYRLWYKFGSVAIRRGMEPVVSVKGKDSYSLAFSFSRTVLPIVALLMLGTARAPAQCSDPGLQLAGEMSVQGSFNKNANATQEVLLPEGIVELDAGWHQTALKAYGGGSDARSPLKPSDLPAGICIVASGNEENEKGWAVHSPSLHVVADDGTRVTRRAFSMTLYCTVGSNELDRLVGPCAVKVRVYYKPKGAS